MDSGTLGVVVGAIGLVWGLASWILSGRQLRRESRKLRRLNTLIMRAFEEAGFAEFNYNDKGEPVGLRLYASAEEVATASASARGHVRGEGES